jgi:hypothetical protein
MRSSLRRGAALHHPVGWSFVYSEAPYKPRQPLEKNSKRGRSVESRFRKNSRCSLSGTGLQGNSAIKGLRSHRATQLASGTEIKERKLKCQMAARGRGFSCSPAMLPRMHYP